MTPGPDSGPRPVHEIVERTADGALIYDAKLVPNATEASFAARGWQTVKPVENVLRSGGRGNTLILGDGQNEFVLRHFRRGGLVGRFVRDAYLWLGEDKTRSFAEWRLLQKMEAMGLPVPKPAIARYIRRGFSYTADIITLRVPDIRSLSARLVDEESDSGLWQRIGAGLAEFHACGVNHADLNAHNVQIDSTGAVWLLDFDKATIQAAGTWQQKNLARLHRSLQKIRQQDPRVSYRERDWEDLLAGYFQSSSSA
ncbi:MAG: 3-deoxy-D-manno-octulosonic acid kinase [Pseudomonadota bacterium]